MSANKCVTILKAALNRAFKEGLVKRTKPGADLNHFTRWKSRENDRLPLRRHSGSLTRRTNLLASSDFFMRHC